MLSKADRNYARFCSQELQKLYELAHKWERLSCRQLPWLAGFCEDIVKLHTRLDQFVATWDYQPKSDENHVSNVSGSSQFNGNF